MWPIIPAITWRSDYVLLHFQYEDAMQTVQVNQDLSCRIREKSGDITYTRMQEACANSPSMRRLKAEVFQTATAVEIRPDAPGEQILDEIVAIGSDMELTITSEKSASLRINDQRFIFGMSTGRSALIELVATDDQEDPKVSTEAVTGTSRQIRKISAVNSYVHIERLSDRDYCVGINDSIYNLGPPSKARNLLCLFREPNYQPEQDEKDNDSEELLHL